MRNLRRSFEIFKEYFPSSPIVAVESNGVLGWENHSKRGGHWLAHLHSYAVSIILLTWDDVKINYDPNTLN